MNHQRPHLCQPLTGWFCLLLTCAASLHGQTPSPTTGRLLWSFDPGVKITSPIAIAPDGTVYVAGSNKKLYAVDRAGEKSWEADLSDECSTLAIGMDGSIYAGTVPPSISPGAGKLFAFNARGRRLWEFATGRRVNGLALGGDGTIYTVSGGYSQITQTVNNKLYALSPAGAKLWEIAFNPQTHLSAPAVAADGTIYLGVGFELQAYTTAGALKWKYATGGYVHSAMAIRGDGRIYIGSDDRKLHVVRPDGFASFTQQFAGPNSAVPLGGAPPVIGADDTAFVGTSANGIVAVYPTGNSHELATVANLTGGPTVSAQNTVYLGTTRELRATQEVTGALALRTLWQFPEGCASDPALDAAGNIYFISTSGILRVVQGNEPPGGPWPMWQRDARRTGFAGSENPKTLGNLLVNGSFETGTKGWESSAWLKPPQSRVAFTAVDGVAADGTHSVQIASPEANDAYWSQSLTVKPNTTYRISGRIKTQNVTHTAEVFDAGANLGVLGSWDHTDGLFGTRDWTFVSMTYDVGPASQLTVAARLGYSAGTTTGTAWFDDLRVEEIALTSSPVITASPETTAARAGTDASFTITTSVSGPFSFQWQRNNVDLPGQTNRSLFLGRVQAADAASYRVRVSNVLGSVTSAPAVLTVHPAAAPALGVDAWTWRNPKLPMNDLEAVAFGNNLFVAVGASGMILTSPDGAAWTRRDGGVSVELRDVTFAQGRFVIVGDDGSVLTSGDGSTWLRRNSATCDPLRAVGYGSSRFVIATDEERFYSSADALTWTLPNRCPGPDDPPRFASIPSLAGNMAYGNGRFVWVGPGQSPRVSTDGAQWSKPSSASGFSIASITFASGQFVAVGPTITGAVVMTSPDGQAWTLQKTPTSSSGLSAVTFGSNQFVAVGSSGEVQTSSDARVWVRQKSVGTDLTAIAFGNGRYVAVGPRGAIVTSSDATTWISRQGTPLSAGGRYAIQWNSLTHGNGVFVAMDGQNGHPWMSVNGSDWTGPSGEDIYRSFGFSSLIYARDRFVGVSDRNAAVGSSFTGITWTNLVLKGAPYDIVGTAYGNGQLVAANRTGIIFASANQGESWTQTSLANDLGSGSAQIAAVAFGNGRFVVTASAPREAALISVDGRTWRSAAGPSGIRDLTFGACRFVALSSSSAYTSADGENWSRASALGKGSFSRIHYAAGIFLAAGTGGVYTSPDGQSWTYQTPGIQEVSDITFGNDTFLIATRRGELIQSRVLATTPPGPFPVALGEALNQECLEWRAGGDLAWGTSVNVSMDGRASAQSRHLQGGEQSWLETSMSGPGTLEFWWKVSSETGGDFLEVHVDGVKQASISGERDWEQKSVLLSAGMHTVRWRYLKNASTDTGLDRGWVDQVAFLPQPPPADPVLTAQPQSQSATTGGTVTLSIVAVGTGNLTYQWRKDGVNLPGATSASLTIANVQPSDAGSYDVVVRQATGSATSSPAVLTVTSGPASGSEGDVAPRPNGNGTLGAADLTVMGRIVAGLETGLSPAEFQRADCAPLSSRGNGVVNVGDLTQVARYVAGLDSPPAAGGPTAPASGVASASGNPGAVVRKNAPARRISVVQDRSEKPGTITALIQASTEGNENALSFSLDFDAARLNYSDVSLGHGAVTASLVINTDLTGSGQLGVVIAMPANEILPAGTIDLLRVRFASTASSGTVPVGFGSRPAATSASDLLGNDLALQFLDGTLQMGSASLPVIREIRVSGATLSADLTGFAAGATVILQTSPDLLHWRDVQTFTAHSNSISIQRPVQPNAAGEYLRFLVR